MDTTRAQQQALDDELVAPADRLKIGKSNLRLSSILKSKEPTLQVALDALKLTPFYNAFEISADVPEIYMQEFWVTVSRHHSSLRFKLNGKSHTVNVDNFRDMLKICPKLPGQIFEEPPLEEEILSFIRDLGHTREIKFLSDVNMVSTPPDYEITEEEEENQEDDDNVMGGEQEDEEDEELYGDLNLNLERRDAQVNQEKEEVHVTFTTELPVVQQQSSSISSDLVSNSRHRVSSLETELFELKQTNQFAEVVSSIPGIVDNYLASKMKDEVNVAIQLKSNNPREEAQAENEEFLNQIESNIKAIIKDQVQAQVKAKVSKILPKVEKFVTESLGAEVLARSSNQPQISYAVAASLSEFELKKILIDKIDENKSMNRSDVQKNLYNALIESYNSDKDLFASYGDVVTLREDVMIKSKMKNPPLDQTEGRNERDRARKSHQKKQLKRHLEEAFKATHDQLDWHNLKERSYLHDLSKPLPLIQNARGRQVIPFDHFINNDLEYLKGGSLSQRYTTSITKTKVAEYGHVKWIEDKSFYRYATNMETLKDVYSRHKIITVTSLKIMEFFGYKHLEEFIVRRQDDQMCKFREGDFKRLRRQDIEDMLLLLVQRKLTNLNLDERFALNVALRMYMRCVVIQERVEDLQLVVESYQKKINLSRPDSYRSDLQKMTPYTAYPDIQGIIYQDDMDINHLMRTDELHKFSNGTLNHVRIALNDIATRIQMEYLPKRKWTKQDKQRARVMINAIDKKLRDRRLMRSLEKFVGGRPYRGDLRLLQRTI
ncbi:hypothetical protein Tco_0640197 [Tanacetum coccineum]